MELVRFLRSLGSRDDQPARSRFPEPLDTFDQEVDAPETKGARRRRQLSEVLRIEDLVTLPWIGWLFVYAFVLFCYSASRCVVLKSLVTMYGSPRDYTASFKIAALTLGFMEDFVCATYLTCFLWLFDSFKLAVVNRLTSRSREVIVRVVGSIATFTVSWFSFVIVMTPFAADLLLVINRDMRFTLDLVATLIRERHHLNAAPISTEEIQRGYMTAALVASAATVFAYVRARASWADLACWNPTHIVVDPVSAWGRSFKLTTGMNAKYEEVALEEGAASPKSPSTSGDKVLDKLSSANSSSTYRALIINHTVQVVLVLTGLVALPALVVAVRCECSPLVAYSALNATLNELFGHALQPAPTDATFTNVNGNQWVEMYIHPTERHKLFGDDSLYRLTTGFRGDLAFDVSVSTEDPPNVLIITVESFRFRDSRFMVGKDDPSNLFKDTDLTITPNFDSATETGITGGKEDTELAANYNITQEEWLGEEHRGFNWGVHDDVSFEILGDLLVNKTRNQTEQMANGEPKEPLFITHYTITSHAPFHSWPTWYDKSEKPDFSALYEGEGRAEDIQRYLEARYFTDMELGRFLDRMADEGILKDTIVVIVGDHGRLENAAGLVLEDAAEHYDILNTLADITVCPREVRGNQRLRYDGVTDVMLLHNTETDYNMAEDLLPELSPDKQAEWQAWRDNGRRISAYYTKRWDENCLLAVNCTAEVELS
uniref:Sulfatase N-terminal domain-containing protein n=1 Tax=Phytophthora fragariae TaxID=53985 RepID=A0A6A3EHG0_9STRA|nr:hypothetical protein PF009_g17085 [Phytophthora fragariae]